ncbi:hypothetical protein KAR91_10615 [Candidatus Pacearchaeota archaeon]|nr:hypothetical protein [Candidatus Pacearchaeota archaeon]
MTILTDINNGDTGLVARTKINNSFDTITNLDWQNSVLSRFDPTGGLPAATVGDRYLATDTANGWTNDNIYEYDGASWIETIALQMMQIGVDDEAVFYYFDGTTWIKSTTFDDVNFELYNAVDITKIVQFDLSGLTTANTRTLTVPDSDGTLLTSTAYASFVDHNVLVNYVANQHIDHTSVTFSAGNGLSGGGDISANRSFTLDLDELTSIFTMELSDDVAVIQSSDGSSKKINFQAFNESLDHSDLVNLQGGTSNQYYHLTSAEHSNLTGGTPTFDALTVNGPTLIDGAADTIQLKVIGHSTQTANIFEIENSSNSDLFTVDNTGDVTAAGTISAATLTDGTVIVTGGAITGVTNLDMSGELHMTSALGTDRMHFESNVNGDSAMTQSHPGVLLTSNTMGTTSKYTPGFMFGSTDANFTTNNPKFLAGIVGYSTEDYAANTDGGMGLEFLVSPDAPGATPVPGVALQISNEGLVNLYTTSTATEAALLTFNAGDGRTMTILQPDNADDEDPFTFTTNNSFQFRVDSKDALKINASGNVGINKTNPAVALDVSGSVTLGDAGTDVLTISGLIEILNTGSSIFIGENAGSSDDLTSNVNVFIGQNAGRDNTTGAANVFIGANAGQASVNDNNSTIVGYNALSGAVTGHSNTALGNNTLAATTSGDSNVAVGYLALQANTDGKNNIAVGRNTLGASLGGDDNLGIGRQAGGSLTSGSRNLFIGYLAGSAETSTSDKLYIANSATTTPLIYGDFSTAALTVNGTLDVTSDLTVDTDTFHVDATNGLVGIGTTSPNYLLTVYEDSSLANYMQFINSTTGVASTNGLLIGIDDNEEGLINLQEDKLFTIAVNGTDRFIIQRGSANGTVDLGAFTTGEGVRVGDLFSGGYAGIKNTDATYTALVQNSTDHTVLGYGSSAYLRFLTNDTNEIMRLDGSGNMLFGTASSPAGTNGKVMLFGDNAGDPTTPATTAGFFAKDVSASLEMFAVDEADNVTQLSPHNPETGEWYYTSRNTRTKREVIVDLEGFFKHYDDVNGTSFFSESKPLEALQENLKRKENKK